MSCALRRCPQYTRRDWRNRNRIKTPHGPIWLRNPVQVRLRAEDINETLIADPSWGTPGWRTIAHAYARAPYFAEYHLVFEPPYLDHRRRASARRTTVCSPPSATLRQSGRSSWSSDYDPLRGGRTSGWIEVRRCWRHNLPLGASREIVCVDEAQFARAGIAVEGFDYTGYPESAASPSPFDHYVSVLDPAQRRPPGTDVHEEPRQRPGPEHEADAPGFHIDLRLSDSRASGTLTETAFAPSFAPVR